MEGMSRQYKLVLVCDIHNWEDKGWHLVNNKVHCMLGGLASVWMWREDV